MQRVNTLLEYFMAHPVEFMLHSRAPEWIPLPGRNKTHQVLESFRAVAGELFSRGYDANLGTNSLFGAIAGSDPRAPHITSRILELLLAGYETTASTISWIMVRLAKHPDIHEKVLAELADTLDSRHLVFDDLSRLSYLKSVIAETLRMYPTAYLMWSRCVEDDIIDGYEVPQGTRIVISAYHVHRHPDAWVRPNTFDPGRFANEPIKNAMKGAYTPFGMGTRQCLGNLFALINLQTAMIRIVQRYRFRLRDSTVPLEPSFGVALRPSGSIRMTIERR
jgi:cytochrome P450